MARQGYCTEEGCSLEGPKHIQSFDDKIDDGNFVCAGIINGQKCGKPLQARDKKSLWAGLNKKDFLWPVISLVVGIIGIVFIMRSCSVSKVEFQMLSPSGHEIYCVGGKIPIAWRYSGTEQLKLEFSNDSGKAWSLIASDLNCQIATYMWGVPDISSKVCLIRVSEQNNPQIFAIMDSAFSIIPTPPLRLDYPKGGENFSPEDSVVIAWSGRNDISQITIELSTNNGKTWTIIGQDIPGKSGKYKWIVPNVKSHECLIRISDGKHPEINSVSDAPFVFASDTYIHLRTPNGGELYRCGSQQTILWRSKGVQNVSIELSVNNGHTWTTISETVPSSDNLNSYAWTVPDAPSPVCRVRISNKADQAIQSISRNEFSASQGASKIAFTPSHLEFPATSINSGVSRLALQITNEGTDRLAIINVSFSDNNGAFSIPTDYTFPLYIAPRGTLDLPIKFVPTEQCNYLSVLTIQNNSANAPEQTISLSGVGSTTVTTVSEHNKTIEKANLLISGGQYSAAVDFLSQYIQGAGKGNAAAYYFRALAKIRQEQWDSSLLDDIRDIRVYQFQVEDFYKGSNIRFISESYYLESVTRIQQYKQLIESGKSEEAIERLRDVDYAMGELKYSSSLAFTEKYRELINQCARLAIDTTQFCNPTGR